MWVTGKVTSSTAKLSRSGTTRQSTPGPTRMGRSMAREGLNGLMVLCMTGSSATTMLKVKAPSHGRTDVSTRASGLIIVPRRKVPPQIFVSHIFEELCIEDVVQVLQLHRKTFEIGEIYQRVLRFALRRLAFGLGRCKTSLKTWLQIFEAVKAGNFQSNCADLQRLNGLISFKHTRYCTERGDYVEPLPWSFRVGSVEPFIRFLWRECTASTSPFPSIRAATFVEVLGGEKKTILQRRPLAIIALDATYCENGVKDEFFNMATLLLLDDLKVALLLAWAVDIQENEGFFAMVFIGNHLVEVMNYASKIFEAPPWTWKENELTHWFGFDMTKVASFEDKIEILEKFPRINSAIQTALFRDLERFVRHMHNLRMHGEGRYEWPDGRAYEGQYMNDLKEGEGTFLWADGRKFTGQWKDGKQHGVGVFRTAHGDQRTGEWREGVRVCWVDEAPNNVQA
eukprot:symbB.v1.2.003657.t2/scaffold175.1/size369221/13